MSHQAARKEYSSPDEYLLARVSSILAEVDSHFLPTSVEGDYGLVDERTKTVRPGGEILIADEEGLRPTRLIEALRSQVQARRDRSSEWASFDFDITGRTLISYPTAEEVRDEFIGFAHYGPWATGRGRKPPTGADWFNEVLAFGTIPDRDRSSVFLTTHSWIWNLAWEGVPSALAEEATRRNRGRLTLTLDAMRKALPEAEFETSNPTGDPPTSERGYDWSKGATRTV